MFVHKLPFLLNPVFCILQSSIISNLIWKENAHTEREYKTCSPKLICDLWSGCQKMTKWTLKAEKYSFSWSFNNFLFLMKELLRPQIIDT